MQSITTTTDMGLDHDQRMTLAMMDYFELLDGQAPILSVRRFVATRDADLRDELPDLLEFAMLIGEPTDAELKVPLTEEEQAMVDRAIARATARFLARSGAPTSETPLTWRIV